MVFYDYNWTYYTLQVEWTSIINSSFNATNWYLRHKKTFGSIHWMSKFVGAILCVDFAVCYLSIWFILYHDSITWTIAGIAVLLIATSSINIFYIVVQYRTPNVQKFSDRFFIHWESKLIAKILAAFAVLTITMFTVSGICLRLFPYLAPYVVVLSSIAFPSVVGALIYVSSALIIHKNLALYGDTSNNVSISMACFDSNSASTVVGDILSNKDALHLFMVYLSKEYSMEILLAFIEFSQYLDYLDALKPNIANDGTEEENAAVWNSVFLSDSVPISSIVQNKNKDHGFKQKAYELYCKYIARGSEYEINISSRLRNQCSNLMNNFPAFLNSNVEITDLEPIFTNCKAQLLAFLSYSHSRFTKSDEYAAVQQIISPHEAQAT